MKDIDARKRDVMAARAALFGTVEMIKERVTPSIVTDVVRHVTRKTVASVANDSMRTARRRPLAAAGAGLAAVVWLFRKPIIKAWRSARQKERNDE